MFAFPCNDIKNYKSVAIALMKATHVGGNYLVQSNVIVTMGGA